MVPWNDPRPHAAWRAVIYDIDAYLGKYCHEGCHPLNRFPGSLPQTNFLDLLHVLDHRGVTSYVTGNVLWTIVSDRELGATHEQSFQAINARLAQFYTDHAVKYRMPPLNCPI